MTNEHLLEIFSIYGPVATAEIEKDPRVGLSKGSAYVTFKKSKDMNQAMLHLDGAQLDGNVIKATFVLVANKRRREPSLGNLLSKCSCTLNFYATTHCITSYLNVHIFPSNFSRFASKIGNDAVHHRVGLRDRAKEQGLERRVEGT